MAIERKAYYLIQARAEMDVGIVDGIWDRLGVGYGCEALFTPRQVAALRPGVDASWARGIVEQVVEYTRNDAEWRERRLLLGQTWK